MTSAAISVSQVSKTFGGLKAVDDATFEVQPGECFGLLGPNGAGKSTLIRMLYGATSRSAGQMTVLGLDPVHEGRALRRRLGVVTQDDALDEQMTVAENMFLYASFLGLRKHLVAPRIHELLAFLSLEHRANARILTLSGGMKRRLVFVRALLSTPELLILDEPTTGLDPAVRQLLWDKIRALKRQGTTILLTTHYMDEAEFLCDRLVILERGAIRIAGAPRALISGHCQGYVALWANQLATSAPDDGTGQPTAHRRIEAKSLADLSALIDLEPTQPEVIRPANLEDVFLKITGRELGGDA